MSGNSGAWGIAMWKDGRGTEVLSAPQDGISLSGGHAIDPFLATIPLGCLTAPPDGMGVPPVRNGDVAFAQRDGVVQFGDYYEPRQITLQVDVSNDGCPGCAPVVNETFLDLNGVIPGRATTPNSPSLNITGDIDIRAHIAMDDWTPASQQVIESKWGAAGTRSQLLRVETSGALRLFWTQDGTTALSAASSVLPAMASGEDLWVRATLDVDNGAGGRDIRFYTSTNGVIWTQFGGTVTQAGVTSIFAGTAALDIGSDSNGTSSLFAGQVFSLEIRSGIDGTIIASPDFTDVGVGSVQFQDDQGNLWSIISPAVIAAAPAPAPMSARQKVKRLTEEWSRNCDGATLVVFSDCHDPDAAEEEKTYLGPYLVHGRPRVAEVTWRPSNIGGASVLLRFDAEDARLRLATTNEGENWFSEHTMDAPAGSGGGNISPNYTLDGLTMTLNGATVQDTHLAAGGPDDGPYFQRIIQASNTTSPMSMPLTGTGLSGMPVNPGEVFSFGWWVRKNPGGGPAPRLDWSWYNAAGALISNHSGAAQPATAAWQRVLQENIVAPALAEFVQWRLVWTGTAPIGQTLDFAQAWLNYGVTATGPEEIEVVGDLCVFPVITLFGPLTAPINVFYGTHQFTYNANVSGAESVTIDTRWGRAATITVDTTQEISGDYTSPLDPGTHDFSFTTGNPADTGSTRIEWSNAVVSG